NSVNRNPSLKSKINFHATCHTTEVVQQVVRDFLFRRKSEKIAMLVESGTESVLKGADQAKLVESATGSAPKGADKANPDPSIVYYQFPLNVARLRDSYAKKGESDTSSTMGLRSTERLEVSSDGQNAVTEVIAPKRPEVTTPLDELVLDEILMDIAHREIRFVGIVATDPLDIIFLAQRVRRFVPDARLFTTQNNLAFIHPKTIADLRGMIVGSTYPLAAQNQAWSYSYRGDDKRVFFTSDDSQGVYNATVAHLHDMKVGNGSPK